MSDVQESFFASFEEIDNFYQSKKLPRYKITMKGTANNISNLMDILLRKSLIKEDIYNYDNDEKNHGFFCRKKKFSLIMKNLELCLKD